MTDTSTTKDDAKQAAGDVASHGKEKAAGVASSAHSEARSVAADAKDRAADVVGTAREELRSQAASQAETLSATLSDVGRQLGDMADSSSDPEAQVAQLARSAADTLSRRAERIDDSGLDGVIDDAKRFARNRPGAFLLGSIAAGFAIGRLVKHADTDQARDHAKDEFDADALKSGNGSNDSDSATSLGNASTASTSTGGASTGSASTAGPIS